MLSSLKFSQIFFSGGKSYSNLFRVFYGCLEKPKTSFIFLLDEFPALEHHNNHTFIEIWHGFHKLRHTYLQQFLFDFLPTQSSKDLLPSSDRPRGLMDKASDFGSEDWGFESLRGRFLFRQQGHFHRYFAEILNLTSWVYSMGTFL